MAEYDFNQKLPKSEIVESGYLESMLYNFAASYKLFWFKGIFIEVQKGNTTLEYRRIVARMIAEAWYPVVFYNLSLGFSDKLADTIRYIQEELHIAREEKPEKIVEFICNCNDKKLAQMIKDFTNFVPFRLIRPFYQREIDFQRKHDLTFRDSKINRIIEEHNQNDQNNALYVMNRIDGILTVSAKWETYLKKNAAVIEGWLNYKLTQYIQQRNPNVPAIPFKLFPPTSRDRNLSEAIKFWKMIQTKMKLYDLYTGKEFTNENFEQYGTFSVDHFIPWSFVLHNEIWNLYPMFKNINSSKNSMLPDKERYLDKFCECQYQAFIKAKKLQVPKKVMEQYLNVKRDIFCIGESDAGHDVFLQALKQTIEPLYQIANNQGYGIWWYE